MSGLLVGFEDGNGNVLTGQEDDEQPAMEETAAQSFNTQYTPTPTTGPGLTEFDAGQAYSYTPPEPVAPPEPAGSTFFQDTSGHAPEPEPQPSIYDQMEPFFSTPTPEPKGSSFFGEHGLELGEAGSAPLSGSATYVFDPTSPDAMMQNIASGGLDLFLSTNPEPQPGDGSLWFGTEDEQQQQYLWWQSEIDKALTTGDMATYRKLIAEKERVDRAWREYQGQHLQWQDKQQQFLNQYAQDITSPMGEGLGMTDFVPDTIATPEAGLNASGGIMLRTDIRRQYEDELRQRQLDDFMASVGGAIGPSDTDLEMSFAALPEELRQQMLDAARAGQAVSGSDARGRDRQAIIDSIMGGGNTYYNGKLEGPNFYGAPPEPFLGGPVGDYVLPAIGAGFHVAANLDLKLPGAGDLTVGNAVKGAWTALNYTGEKGGQALIYAEAFRDYYVFPTTATDTAKERGMSGLEYARYRYDTISGIDRAFYEIAGDPLNYIPIGGIAKRAGQSAAMAARDYRLSRGIGAVALTPKERSIVSALMPQADITVTFRQADKRLAQALNLGLNSKVDMAMSRRIATMAYVQKALGGEVTADFIKQQLDALPDIAKGLSATEKEADRVRQIIDNRAQAISDQMNTVYGVERGQIGGLYQLPASTSLGVPVGPAQTRPYPVNPTPVQQVAKAAEEMQVKADEFLVPTRDAVEPVAQRGGVMRSAEYMQANPRGFKPGRYEPDAVGANAGQLVSEAKLLELEKAALTERVKPFDPIRQLQQRPVGERTMAVADEILMSGPPTQAQVTRARRMLDRKQITKATHDRIVQGRVTALDAYDLLPSGAKPGVAPTKGAAIKEAVSLNGRGQPVTLRKTDPNFGAQLNAARDNDAHMTQLSEQIDSMLPKGPIRDRNLPDTYGRQVRKIRGKPVQTFQGLEVMPLDRLHRLVVAHATDFRTGSYLNQFAIDVLRSPLYVKFSGELSEDTANRFLFDKLAMLRRDLANGAVPQDEVRLLHRLLSDEYTVSPLALSEAQALADKRLAALSEAERGEYLADVARRKEENAGLLAELPKLRAARKTDAESEAAFQSARRQIERNTNRIQRVEPGYRPEPPKKTPTQKVAERDAKLADAGLTQAQSSPPEQGFVPETVGTDSTNDILGKVANQTEPTATPAKITFEPKQQTLAEMPGRTTAPSRTQLRAHVKAVATAREYVAGLSDEQVQALVKQMTHVYDATVLEPAQVSRGLSRQLKQRGMTPDALAEVLAEQTGMQLPLRMRDRAVAAVERPTTYAALRDHPEWTTTQKATHLASYTDDELRTLSASFDPADTTLGPATANPDYKVLERELLERGLPSRSGDSRTLSEWYYAPDADLTDDVRSAAERLTWANGKGQRTPLWTGDEAALRTRLGDIGIDNLSAEYDIAAKSPTAGLGSPTFRESTVDEISDRIGNLMSKYSKPGRPLPNWVRKKIESLEEQAANIRGSGYVGSSDSFMHPSSQRLLNALPSRPVKPVIDFEADAWAKIDWTNPDHATAFDAMMDDLYGNAFKDYGVPLGSKEKYATELQTQVVMTTDVAANHMRGWMDEALGTDDPHAYVLERLREIADPKTSFKDVQAINPFYVNSREGADMVRMLRRHFTTIEKKWNELNPHQSIGWFGSDVLPPGTAGVYSSDEMEQIHRLMTGTDRPQFSDPEAAGIWRQFQSSNKKVWTEQIEPVFSTKKGGKRTWSDTHIDRIDAVLFPDEAQAPIDIPKLAERIAGAVADAEAKRIGFNPDLVPASLRVMANIKGNFVPFWMTLNPSYTINNAGGNASAQLLGALHSDFHAGANILRRDPVFTAALDDAGSGIVHPVYLDTNLARQQTEITDVPSASGRGAQSAADKVLHSRVLNPIKGKGVGTYHDAMAAANNGIEKYFKENIFGREFLYTYRKNWQRAIDGFDSLPDGAVEDLVQAVGIRQTTLALEKHAVDPELRKVIMAQQRSAISAGNVRAYHTTKAILRDYRMRNRLDGILDRIVPVHYWTTKNAAFVASVAADRPSLIPAAAGVYDAWQEQNKDLPPSMRTGYIPIPGSFIPKFGDDRTWHLRVSQFVNPALFVVPKLLNPQAYDWDGDAPILDRISGFAGSAVKNAWKSMGYIPSPVLQVLGLGAENLSTHWGDPNDPAWQQFIGKAATEFSFFANPSGYRNDIIPYQNQLGRSQAIQQYAIETFYSNVAGTSYNKQQLANFFRRTTELEAMGDLTHAESLDMQLALAEGRFDAPGVRDVIDDVLDDGAWMFLIAKAGAGGKEITQYDKDSFQAGETFDAIKLREGTISAQSWALKNKAMIEPAFTLYLDQQLAAGKIDADQYADAKDAVLVDGNLNNPLFQDAVEAAERRNRTMTTQGKGIENQHKYQLTQLITADHVFEQKVASDGYPAAYDWMEENAPYLRGHWAAYGDLDKTIDSIKSEQRRGEIDRTYDKADAFYANRTAERNEAAPYYERIDKIHAHADGLRGRSKDSPLQLAMADRSERNAINRVYDDAEKAGVKLVSSHNLPKQGINYYDRTGQQQHLLEANGATEAVNDLERAQAQRGHILDMTANELGVDSKSDEFQDENGHFDKAKYEAAVRAAAADAPGIYNQLVGEFVALGEDHRNTPLNGGLHLSLLTESVTADDFLYHMLKENYPYEEQLQKDYDTYRAAVAKADKVLDSDREGNGKERLAAQQAKTEARDALVGKYGEDVFDLFRRKAHDTPDATAAEHAKFSSDSRAIEDLYFTLTPREKDEFKEQYPDAFEWVVGVDKETEETYRYQRLVGTKLTGDQQAEIMAQYDISVRPALPDEANLDASSLSQYQDVGANQQRIRQTNFIKQKGDEFDTILTDEEQMAVDTYRDLKENPRWDEMLALKESSVTKSGYPSWKIARRRAEESGDTEMVELIDARAAAVEDASPVWQKQEDWFFAQSKEVQDLLIAEDPGQFGHYADAIPGDEFANGGTSSTSSATGSYGTGGSSKSSTSKSKSSGGSSSTYRSGSSSGSSTRSTGGSSTGGTPVVMDLAPVLRTLDPVLAAGEDDGRGAIVQQVGDRLGRQFMVWQMLPNGMGNLLQSLILTWLTKRLGTAPTLDTWNQILALLSQSDPNTPRLGAHSRRQPPKRPIPQVQQPANYGY